MNIKQKSGFTLLESIIYIGITAVVVLSLISLAWSFINNHTKEKITISVNNNASFVMDQISSNVERAVSLGGATVYDSNPGTLVINVPTDPVMTIDTTTKGVTCGDEDMTITKLQLTQDGSTYDLTSDKVTVDNFVVTDLSSTGDTTIQIELTLSYPVATTKIYEYEKSFTTSATIKKK